MAEVLVLQVLSALLLMLADAAAMLLLELELAAAMLEVLHVLAAALLYQLACRAWASALERHPLRRQQGKLV